MKEVTVKIDTIDKVKEFCRRTNRINSDIIIESGRYAIDGKSIMGLFSLDLSKPLVMKVVNDDVDIEALRDFFYEPQSKVVIIEGTSHPM